MSADMRPANYPVDLIRGDDWTLVVTAVDEAGDPVDLSSATITGDVLSTGASRTVVDTMTDAVSGAGSNVITLSFTDTETDALTATQYVWSLEVTIGTDTRQWLAGEFNVWSKGDARATSTSGAAVTATVDNTVTLTIVAAGGIPDVAATVGIVDAGGYFTGTNVETVTQEIGAGTITQISNKLPLAGGTVTGSVTFSAAAPQVNWTETDQAADNKTWKVWGSGSSLYFSAYNDAGSAAKNPLFLNRTGVSACSVNMNGADTVAVPVATAAGNAAQVSAISAGVGRFEVGSKRGLNSTGLRNVTTLLINGWTGTVYLAREGNTVHWLVEALNGSAATDNIFMNIPTGFAAPTGAWRFTVNLTDLTIRRGFISTTVASITNTGGGTYYGSVAHPCYVAHPTSLPGTAA